MYKNIALGNVFEFNYRNFNDLDFMKQQRENKANYAVSAEYALFWCGSDTLVLTPEPIDGAHLEDVSQILGLTAIRNLHPKFSSGALSFDVKNDLDLLSEISRISSTNITLASWGVTPWFYELISTFSEKGLIPSTKSEFPLSKDYWTCDYIDAKLGAKLIFYSVASEIDYFDVPFAVTIETVDELGKVLQSLVQRQMDLIVKANFGHGGRQMFIVAQDEFHAKLEELYDAIRRDRYWEFRPIIVEHFICGEDKRIYPTVSYDGYISENGRVLTKGVSSSHIANRKNYLGLEIGQRTLVVSIAEKIVCVGRSIGEKMAALGYRGWFDIDMLLTETPFKLYGLEINPRRNGGTHVINIGEILYGDQWWEQATLLSCDRLFVKPNINGYNQIQPFTRKINAEYAADGSGFLPVLTRSLTLEKPYIGYVVFGTRSEIAHEIDHRVRLELGYT